MHEYLMHEMAVGRIVLGEVIAQVLGSLGPVKEKLPLLNSVLDPVIDMALERFCLKMLLANPAVVPFLV